VGANWRSLAVETRNQFEGIEKLVSLRPLQPLWVFFSTSIVLANFREKERLDDTLATLPVRIMETP